MQEQIAAREGACAGLRASQGLVDELEACGRYEAVCRDADGVELWREAFDNVVTTLGRNALLDTFFAGSGYTAAMALGLKGSGTAAAADTMAAHAGWSEVGGTNAPAYSGTRATPTWSAAASGSKTMSASRPSPSRPPARSRAASWFRAVRPPRTRPRAPSTRPGTSRRPAPFSRATRSPSPTPAAPEESPMKFRIMRETKDGFEPTGEVFETKEADPEKANELAARVAVKAFKKSDDVVRGQPARFTYDHVHD